VMTRWRQVVEEGPVSARSLAASMVAHRRRDMISVSKVTCVRGFRSGMPEVERLSRPGLAGPP
jgi:hypothetical protein